MEFNTIIKFKSTEDNYRKETSGIKRNTVRVLSGEDESYLQFILKDIKFIRISLSESEYFIRPLTDITWTEYQGLNIYIFSW